MLESKNSSSSRIKSKNYFRRTSSSLKKFRRKKMPIRLR